MTIIETHTFRRRIDALMPSEDYRLLQLKLLSEPDAGSVVPSSGGVRKIRWSISGRGKRGGLRVMYCHNATRGVILMLFVFAKNERSDLTKEQLAQLSKMVQEEIR